MKTVDLLYISFVDLDGQADTGSSVRPKQMLKAFREAGCKVHVLDGWNNHRKERRRRVKETMRWLDNHEVRYCYVEPPSGPFFVHADHVLLKKIHARGIPIGLFYRDIYWRFKNQFSHLNLLKFWAIQWMQRYDLAVFKKNVSLFYFPTEQMARIADFGVPYALLPPGADPMTDAEEREASEKRIREEAVLTLFFVGGLSPRYGFDLLLDALKKVNEQEIRLRLCAVCREQEWLAFQKHYPTEDLPWLSIHHVALGNGLEELYQRADLAVLPLRKMTYTDFAVSVKLFEYAAQEKPIICTHVDAMAEIVSENGLGWVCEDTPEAMAEVLNEALADRKALLEKKEAIRRFLPHNTWKARAQKVLQTLEEARRKQ